MSQRLDACTVENVEQMQHALTAVYRAHSAAYRHDYRASWQVLDVDMSALPTDRTGGTGAATRAGLRHIVR